MKNDYFKWNLIYSGLLSLIIVLIPFIITGCGQPKDNPTKVRVEINFDGKQQLLEVGPGITIKEVLTSGSISYSPMDRIEPAIDFVITQDTTIKITRVKETFKEEEKSIPFEPQTVFNEALPKGQHMNIQEGINGIQKITYRLVSENDIEVSRSIVKTEIIKASIPQIEMVGVQAPIAPIDIPGTIVYLTAGNAWVIENTTGDRRPVVTSGDLDGHIFCLSENGKWLLFTRKPDVPSTEEINTLWFLDLTNISNKPVELDVKNIIHFAEWKPGADLTIGYSTVEPRNSAPGWQANNDLIIISFDSSGKIQEKSIILDSNNGGIYGWWGTSYIWSPDGERLAYSRPDGLGIVDIEKKGTQSLSEIKPYQTGSDWAWVPGISWSPDGKLLFTVTHPAKAGLENLEASPFFDLSALIISESPTILPIVSKSGMFAYPAPTPLLLGNRFRVGYLQAIFSEQSDTSRYQLMTIDQDGSNKEKLFPPDGSQGIDPQQIIWGPRPEEGADPWLALIYQGKLVLINSITGITQQITGDGSVINFDWK